jgi:predicted membrane protein
MKRTAVTHERPWPEAIAGAVIGFQLALVLALVPGLTRYVEDPLIAPFILACGAVLGAAMSWLVAGRSIAVARAKLERPAYVQTRRAA